MSVDSQENHAGVEPFFPIILLVSAKPAGINTIYQLHIFGVELQRQGLFLGQIGPVTFIFTLTLHLQNCHHLCKVANSISFSALANIY